MARSLGKTLRRYIGREIILGFAAGLAIFSFLLLTARIIDLVDLVLARGVPLVAVARLFLLAVPSFLELTMPAAVLLGVLTTFGRLANDGELTAIRAAGVPWLSFLGPVVRAGLAVGLATLAVAAFVRPWANRQIVDAVYDVAKSRAASAIRPGVFNWDFDGIVLYVKRTFPESGLLEGILVADERDERARTRVFAERGSIVADEPARRIRLELSDGTAVTERPGPDSYDLTSFGSFEVDLDVARDLGSSAGSTERPADMPLGRLLAAARTTRGYRPTRGDHRAPPQARIRSRGAVAGVGRRPARGFELELGPCARVRGERRCRAHVLRGVQRSLDARAPRRPSARDRSLAAQHCPRRFRRLRDGATRTRASAHPTASPGGAGTTAERPTAVSVLTRYLVGQYARAFIACLAVATSVMFLLELFEKLASLGPYDAAPGNVAAYLALKIPGIVVDAYPATALLASLVSLGLLARRGEMLALRACGVSRWRVLRPLLVAAFCLSLLMLAWCERVVPTTSSRSRFIRENVIKQRDIQSSHGVASIWMQSTAGFVTVDYYDAETTTLYGLRIFQTDAAMHLERIVQASTASWHDGHWQLVEASEKTLGAGAAVSARPLPTDDVVLTEPPGELREASPKAEGAQLCRARYVDRHPREARPAGG